MCSIPLASRRAISEAWAGSEERKLKPCYRLNSAEQLSQTPITPLFPVTE